MKVCGQERDFFHFFFGNVACADRAAGIGKKNVKVVCAYALRIKLVLLSAYGFCRADVSITVFSDIIIFSAQMQPFSLYLLAALTPEVHQLSIGELHPFFLLNASGRMKIICFLSDRFQSLIRSGGRRAEIIRLSTFWHSFPLIRP